MIQSYDVKKERTEGKRKKRRSWRKRRRGRKVIDGIGDNNGDFDDSYNNRIPNRRKG